VTGRQLAGDRDDLGDLLRGETARATRARLVTQSIQSLGAESSSSAADAVGMAIEPGGDLDIGHPLGRVEDHPRALHITPRCRDLPRTTLELATLNSAQLDHLAAGPGHGCEFTATHQASLT
jgi:hypothetical protein